MNARTTVALTVATALMPVCASGGVYYQMQELVRSGALGPYAIIHPVGYVGDGGVLPIRVCVDNNPTSRPLVGPLQKALEMWNGLKPTTGNCTGQPCSVWEDATFPGGNTDAMSTLVHEAGHCGMGLGHPNLQEIDQAPDATHSGTCDVDSDGCCLEWTSFTMSVNATEVLSTGNRGDATNDQLNQCPTSGGFMAPLTSKGTCTFGVPCGTLSSPCCPSTPPPTPIQVEDFFFFRTSDNNPVVIDSTIISSSTYSRVWSNLPGSPPKYAAHGNRLVAAALGYPNTQSVMYALGTRGRVYSGLTADDVNMVKYANTGKDRLAGNGDDYSPVLHYQSSCTGAQIKVLFSTLAPDRDGECAANVATSYAGQSPFVFHWSLIPKPVNAPYILLMLNTTLPVGTWDLGAHIFSGQGEAGDLREWDAVSP